MTCVREEMGDTYAGDPPELASIPALEVVVFHIASRRTRLLKDGERLNEIDLVYNAPGSIVVLCNQYRVSDDANTIWELAVKEATKRDLGEWAEFGVWEGLSARYWCSHIPKHRKLYLFDSFEGIPEAWEGRQKGHFKPSHIPLFNRRNVVVKEGWFKDTLPLDAPLGFVHIDSDLYSSAKEVLAGINVSKGTLILFDELFGYPGWQNHEYKALMEWDRPFKFVARDKTTRVLIEVL